MSQPEPKPVCGVVMPISAIDGCSESHWADVLDILTDSIESVGFEANLVSNADDVGVIHKRIIQNLYDNPVVVCDVSAKNPNVMFELGLRLAFDKPTIVVKDDVTAYSFDTSAIEHIEYPRDLRFSKIVEFKEKLASKIAATHQKASTDHGYTTFLKHFGEFKVAKLEKREVTGQEAILEEIRSMRFAMRRMERNYGFPSESTTRTIRSFGPFEKDIDVCLGARSKEEAEAALAIARGIPELAEVVLAERESGHCHILATIVPGADVSQLELEKRIGGRVRKRTIRRPAEKG